MPEPQTISFQGEQIWRIYPDEKRNSLALEIKNISNKKNYVSTFSFDDLSSPTTIEISASQTLLSFYDDCLLLSEFDNSSSLSLPKGIQVFDKEFELIWELEDAYFYDIVFDRFPQVIFSLEGENYQLPLRPLQNEISPELIKENKASLIQENLAIGLSYQIDHPHYEDLQSFILAKLTFNSKSHIIHTETSKYLAFSVLKDSGENLIFLTNKEGEVIFCETIDTITQEPVDFMLTVSRLFVLKSKNEVLIFDFLI